MRVAATLFSYILITLGGLVLIGAGRMIYQRLYIIYHKSVIADLGKVEALDYTIGLALRKLKFVIRIRDLYNRIGLKFAARQVQRGVDNLNRTIESLQKQKELEIVIDRTIKSLVLNYQKSMGTEAKVHPMEINFPSTVH